MSAEGIEIRVGKRGRRSFRASVWSNRDQKRIRKIFPSMAAAKTWRADALSAVTKGTMRAPTRKTVAEAFDDFCDGARAGTVHNRSGDPYKPSAIRGYEDGFRLRVKDELGGCRLSDVRRWDAQDLVDSWVAEGLAPSTIDTTLSALRVVFRRALNRGEISVNPTTGIERPAVRSRRDDCRCE